MPIRVYDLILKAAAEYNALYIVTCGFVAGIQ